MASALQVPERAHSVMCHSMELIFSPDLALTSWTFHSRFIRISARGHSSRSIVHADARQQRVDILDMKSDVYQNRHRRTAASSRGDHPGRDIQEAPSDGRAFDHGEARRCGLVCVMRERTPLTREILQQLPNLKLIASTGSTNASIDTRAATDFGIAVTATGYDSTPTIELA
jgi:D-isomer specific 2-hydroxyacid dehydrogenase-like protein